MEEEIAIGIDLGTTNSCVGVVKRSKDNSLKVDILANSMGNRVTPSVVAYCEEGERLVGDAAKDMVSWKPENTIYEVKRLMGRKVTDEDVQNKIARWPFKVVGNPQTSSPYLAVMNEGVETLVTPEQISAAVLLDIIKTAEESLDARGKITKAVITVPAYFNDAQRKATIDAGKIAGLEVLSVINEPTAAAMAYGFERRNKTEQNILVYDLGGGTLDVVILTMKDNEFKVKAIAGNKDLGGSDFDVKLKDQLMKEFEKKHNVDLSNDKRAHSRLLKECEQAKKNLSGTNVKRVPVRIESISNEKSLDTNITRAKLEDVCSDLLDMAIEPLQGALDSANLSIEEIDEVVLVGGSTRIPALQKQVSEFFGGKILNKSINLDEAVAYGAALQAAYLSGDTRIEEVNLFDACPFDLGVTVRNSDFSKIIGRNSTIPVSKTVDYTTSSDNQPSVKIEVQEQEGNGHRNVLGQFILANIEPAPRGTPRIYVTFKINKNGILVVSAEDRRVGSKNEVEIQAISGRLAPHQLDEIRKKEQAHRKTQRTIQENLDARNNLEEAAIRMKRGFSAKKKKRDITDDQFRRIEEVCNDVLQWVEDNFSSSAVEYKRKFEELCTLVKQISGAPKMNEL